MNEDHVDEQTGKWSDPPNIGDVLRGKYAVQTILIVGEHGSIRWSNIKDQLDGADAPVVSDRLDELCSARIAERTAYDEVPPHVEYSLTEKGHVLYENLDTDFVDAFVGKYAIPIVWGLGEHGPVRHMEITTGLDTDSSSTISDHLDKLRDEGFVHRQSYDEVPPHVEYSLTPRGRRLYSALQEMSTL